MAILSMEECQKIETKILKTIIKICKENDIKYFMSFGSALGTIRHQGPIPWDSDVDIAVPRKDIKRLESLLLTNLPPPYYFVNFENDNSYSLIHSRVGVKGINIDVLHIDLYELVGLPFEPEKQEHFIKKSDELRLKLWCRQNKIKHKNNYFDFILRMIANFIRKLFIFSTSKNIYNKIQAHYDLYPFETAKFVFNNGDEYKVNRAIPTSFYGEGIKKTYESFDVVVPKEYDKYLKLYYNDYMSLPPKEEMNKIHTFKLFVEDSIMEKII